MFGGFEQRLINKVKGYGVAVMERFVEGLDLDGMSVCIV
jgi:hypothetical protein